MAMHIPRSEAKALAYVRIMQPPSLALLVSFFCILIPLAASVFADEAYRIDYHHLLLGSPQRNTTFFHRPSATSKASLLYTLSEKLVLGAVNPKDGAVVWRQWLKEGQKEDYDKGYLKALDCEPTVVSAVGNTVSAWDAADGKLVWAWAGDGTVRGLEVLSIEGLKGDVIVASEAAGKNIVTRLEASSGNVVWHATVASGDTPIAVLASPTNIYFLSLHTPPLLGLNPRYTTLDVLTGKQTAQASLNAEGVTTSKDSFLYIGSNAAAPVLVWTDHAFKHLKINVIGGKHITSVNIVNKEKEDIQSISVHAPRTITAQPHFLVHYQTAVSHWAEVYHVDIASGSAKKAYDLPRIGGLGTFSASTIDAKVYFTRNTESEVSLTSSVSHGILSRWPIQPNSNAAAAETGGIAHAVSEVVSKDGSSFSARSALTLHNGNWELFRNSEIIWIRPESLAGVIAAAWADIPAEKDLAKELAVESHTNVLSAYIHRVKRHTQDLKHFPAWLQKIPSRVVGSFMGDSSGTEDAILRPDGFGFRKIAIVATEKGRVMAIDAGAQGAIFWGIDTVNIPLDTKWNVTSIEVEDDRATILVAGEPPIVLETMTGKKVLSGATNSLEPGRYLVPAPACSQGSQCYMTIQADGTPDPVPAGVISKPTTVVTRRPSGEVVGWAYSGGLEPSFAWEFSPQPGEEIQSLITRPRHDPVASIGRALGDRNVLYKYLSQNLVLITAVSLAASTVSIYLLDSVTGHILYTTTHSDIDTSKPIPATFAENWFAYSLFSDPSLPVSAAGNTTSSPKANQLVITELYESSIVNDRGPLGSATNFSSLSLLPLPHALSAAYIIPAGISHLTTTSTLQGITPRAILATVPSLSALISIPLPFLSPRRPVGRDPTSAEQEEGLFRYLPQLDFNPQWTISHKREVIGVQGVLSCPTKMESTSAVMAWGEVDFFGTRVSPIGAFDTLGRGFSRLQLVGTVVALGAGTALLGPMVKRKQINVMWTA
ncbi:hypothetical protein MMC26_006216 [Xylographa opegraphella]|nr:hypothetical protein [Xylographa opegraphella]